MKRLISITLALCVFSASAFAVTPDEALSDLMLETRARALGRELRCVVCQNQSIEDSNAALAHDLRMLLRERLLAGDSDGAAIGYIAARYGDFVLLRPPVKTGTVLLWSGPALFLLSAAGLFVRFLRRAPPPLAALTAQEKQRVATLLRNRETS